MEKVVKISLVRTKFEDDPEEFTLSFKLDGHHFSIDSLPLETLKIYSDEQLKEYINEFIEKHFAFTFDEIKENCKNAMRNQVRNWV